MKAPTLRLMLSLVVMTCANLAHANAAGGDDRLVFSADGATLSSASGGGGGSVGWLHNFNADNLVGAAVEYDTIANGHWTFGSLNASTTNGPANARLSLYGEVHEGAGDLGNHRFNYSIVAVGLIRAFGPHFSLQLDDRQFDVDKARGNLPKVGASVLWSPWLQTAVAYQHSVSGTLGTNLGSLRVDIYAKPINWLAGGAFGQGAPAVFNLQTAVIEPGSGRLREGFFGVSKSFGRADLSVVADYVNLSGTRRATLTVTYIFDLGAARK